MKFQFYYEKLINSEEYQKFKKENPKVYSCSCFFVLDKEKNNDAVHFDFWLPESEEMYSFKMAGPIELVKVENYDKRPFEKLGMDYNFDLNDFEKMILEKMAEEKVKGKIQRLLFSLQKLKGKEYLLVTVFLSRMAILKVNIDIAENKITKFEKKSFFDMIKIMKKDKK